MLTRYRKFKSLVYRTVRSAPDVPPTALTVPFDAVVIFLIFASVLIAFAVTFDLPANVMSALRRAEAVIVILFTVEYALRLWTADLRYPEKGWLLARLRYVFSVAALIDLLAILPWYLPYRWLESMLGIRALRLIRLTRIFKVPQHSRTISAIARIIRGRARELLSVTFFMFMMVIFLSLLLYVAEHDAQPDKFRNAFTALGWAIETFTKSGMHAVEPVTRFGKLVGVAISVLGICLFAIPTGIISSGLIDQLKNGDNGGGKKRPRRKK